MIKHKYSYPYILTIVDVQYKFNPFQDTDAICKVCELVNTAIIDKAFIVLAHYGSELVQKRKHSESTIWSIIMMLDNYEHKAFVNREHCNKEPVIIPVIANLHLDQRLIKVCGLYTDLCVHDTVKGLIKKLPEFKIELFMDACIYYSDTGLCKAVINFRKIDNLVMINEPVETMERDNMYNKIIVGGVIFTVGICFGLFYLSDKN